MFIKSAKLKSFKPFSLSNIQHLSLISSSDIQIFIGDNGSGKSSLLNELHPFAAIRPMYNKKGLKEVILVHKKNEFVLTSDFSSASGSHSFKMNDEELNISGTSGIQNELADHYLGYTPMIHDITHMNYLMCSMSKTERKNLLLELNPVDLSLVLDKHKTLCSKLREFKNNISLLHKKKQEIDTQLLSDDVRKSLANEKERLSKIFNSINSEVYHLQQVQQSINQDLTKFPLEVINFKIENVRKECNHITRFLTECQDVVERDDDSLRNEYTQFYSDTKRIETKVTSLKDQMMSISQEIEVYTKHIQDLGTDVSIDSLQKELKYLQTQKQDVNSKTIIIPEEEYEWQAQKIANAIDYLYNYKDRFRNLVVRADQRDAIIKKHYLLRSKLSSHSSKLEGVEKNIKELEERLSTIPQKLNRFELSQICNECEYFDHFESQLVEITDKLKNLETLRFHYFTKVSKYTKIVEICENFYRQFSDQFDVFSKIVELFAYTAWGFDYKTLRLTYLSDFNQLIQNLKMSVSESPKVYNNNKLDKKIEEINSRITYMLSTGTQSIDILKDLANKKYQDLMSAQDQLQLVENEYSVALINTKKYDEFLVLKSKFNQMESNFKFYTEYVILKANHVFCNQLLSERHTELNKVNVKLLEIENTIQDQAALLARLEDTLITMSSIETQKSELQIIEYGLSPYTGFLNQNLVEFTNVLIHNANCILSQVWSYPLQLIPLDASNPFDGIFPVMVDDIAVPDISRLSKGQQAIINLAWTFAFIFSKKLSDYPVYLDEVDGALDPFHKQKLLEWLQTAMERKYVSQMWLVGHDLVLFNGFNNAQILALMDNNVVQCEKINEHVNFN